MQMDLFTAAKQPFDEHFSGVNATLFIFYVDMFTAGFTEYKSYVNIIFLLTLQGILNKHGRNDFLIKH
jgi:hypothetical protein